MSRSLDDLSSRFRPLVDELLRQAAAAGIEVRIIDTLRTPAEQEANVAKGVSWTLRSKHLPGPEGKAEAIDIAPISVLGLKAWAPRHADWQRLGLIGENLGLRWGGRWIKTPDLAHFEYLEK